MTDCGLGGWVGGGVPEPLEPPWLRAVETATYHNYKTSTSTWMIIPDLEAKCKSTEIDFSWPCMKRAYTSVCEINCVMSMV